MIKRDSKVPQLGISISISSNLAASRFEHLLNQQKSQC